MKMILKLLINALALIGTAWIVPGISIDSIWTAIVAAIVLAIINIIIRPIMLFITIPVNILTLGLFTFVINALMLWLASLLVSGFTVAGLVPAILGAIILAIISTLLHTLLENNGKDEEDK
jgi:putative membrane protein